MSNAHIFATSRRSPRSSAWRYFDAANTNHLASVKQGTTTLRVFIHDAAGNMTRDTRGKTRYNYTISAAGRISQVTLGTSIRADYVYDGKSRLASRVTQNQLGAGEVRYVHDNDNRIIAELDATGTTLREYAWLDDVPVAVLDGTTNTANPSLFFVHADHLNRPVAMSSGAKSWVWRADRFSHGFFCAKPAPTFAKKPMGRALRHRAPDHRPGGE
jgi:hypothetical protein